MVGKEGLTERQQQLIDSARYGETRARDDRNSGSYVVQEKILNTSPTEPRAYDGQSVAVDSQSHTLKFANHHLQTRS
jgi:hypothetical protein